MIDHLVMSTMFEVNDGKNARDMSSPRRYHSTYDLMTAFGEGEQRTFKVHSRGALGHSCYDTTGVCRISAFSFRIPKFHLGASVYWYGRAWNCMRARNALHFVITFLPLAKLRPRPMVHHENDNDQN